MFLKQFSKKVTYSVIEEIKVTKIISKFDVHYNLFTKDLFGLSIMLNLMLNVRNIKERRSIGDYSPVLIGGEKAEQVTTFKGFTLIVSYSGFITWSMCVHKLVSALRRLRVHGVDKYCVALP